MQLKAILLTDYVYMHYHNSKLVARTTTQHQWNAQTHGFDGSHTGQVETGKKGWVDISFPSY